MLFWRRLLVEKFTLENPWFSDGSNAPHGRGIWKHIRLLDVNSLKILIFSSVMVEKSDFGRMHGWFPNNLQHLLPSQCSDR